MSECLYKLLSSIVWDRIGVIATVAAVIVALYANTKSTKQLIAALKIQEQSKNVELLGKRFELLERMRLKGGLSETALRVLFNDEILSHYINWENHMSEKKNAEFDKKKFFEMCREPDGAGGFVNTIRDRIEQYEINMGRPDCPQNVFIEYETFCNDNSFTQRDEEGNIINYNYSDIQGRIAKANEEAENELTMILYLMEKFISDSLRPIELK